MSDYADELKRESKKIREELSEKIDGVKSSVYKGPGIAASFALFIIFMKSCSISNDVDSLTKKVEFLEKGQKTLLQSVQGIERKVAGEYETEPRVFVQNTYGSDLPETYVVVNGQRFYLRIDDRSVESYMPGKKAERE